MGIAMRSIIYAAEANTMAVIIHTPVEVEGVPFFIGMHPSRGGPEV
jgi:hypothetical protein